MALSRRTIPGFAVFALAVLAACGGGVSSAPPTSGGTAATQRTSGQASFSIAIPRGTPAPSTRHRAYVSPNTASISIVAQLAGASPLPAVVTNVPSTPCPQPTAGGTITCIITVQAYDGNNTFTIAAYSQANAQGTLLADGSVSVLVGASSSPSPIAITLGGVINTLSMQIQQSASPNPYVPVGGTATLVVTATDPSGATILGQYDNPITLALPSGSNLALSSSSITNSSTSVTIGYTGAPVYDTYPKNPVTISASGDGGSAQATFYSTAAILQFPVQTVTSENEPLAAVAAPNGHLIAATVSEANYPPTSSTLFDFNPTTASPVPLNVGIFADSLFADSYNDIWVADQSNGVAGCFTSIAGPENQVNLPAVSFAPTPSAIGEDSANNMWFVDQGNNTLDFAPITSACGVASVSGNNALNLGTPPEGESPPEPYLIFGDPAVTRMWFNDQENLDDVGVVVPASSAQPTYVTLPDNNSYVVGFARGPQQNLWIADDDYTEYEGLLAFVGPNTTALGSPSIVVPGSFFPDSLANDSAYSQLGFVTGSFDGDVGVYNFAASSFAFAALPPGPEGDSVCADVVFDASGEPWAFCTNDSDIYFAHVAVNTAAWTAFPEESTIDTDDDGIVDIAGGPSGTTFTLACSGAIVSCSASSSPNIIIIGTGSSTGTGTLTITGSNGEAQSVGFSVIENDCAVHPSPRPLAGARGRLLAKLQKLRNTHARRLRDC